MHQEKLTYLVITSKTVLNQLQEFVRQLDDLEYHEEMEVLGGSTIGKHVRHVLEFFDTLISSHDDGSINYDERKRDPILEGSRGNALSKIAVLTREIESLDLNKRLELEMNYSTSEGENVVLNSSVPRELAYNIEHAVHHMAILKIAVKSFPSIQLPANFGIAFSTIRHEKSLLEK